VGARSKLTCQWELRMGTQSDWTIAVSFQAERGAYQARVGTRTGDGLAFFYGWAARPLRAVEQALNRVRSTQRRYPRGRMPEDYKVACLVR
jgi:hypothetical protein